MAHFRLLACVAGLCSVISLGQDRDARISNLDKKLTEAREAALTLQKTIEALSGELAKLRTEEARGSAQSIAEIALNDTPVVAPGQNFKGQMLRPDLGSDERESKLTGRPELFIQSRYQTLPIAGTDLVSAPSNFVVTRMESRWSGRLSEKVGIGFEIQYHPAPMGAAAEIVNDAFVEYYPTERITFRAGQFVKPFGFDVQQSSSLRESPERGMFAGYFFPGQRDRGLMVSAKLDALGEGWQGTRIDAAILNGNRFFVDSNRQLNYNVRVRKTFSSVPLAVGVSAQFGTQIIPPGFKGSARENEFGADAQWAWKRFGLRAEIAGGNMPSTLVGIQPEFATRFRAGAHSAGGTLFSGFELTSTDQIYARYDQFNGDPFSGGNVRAFNLGFLRKLGDHSRVAVDYQFKSRPSFNDDFVNTRLQVVWNVVY